MTESIEQTCRDLLEIAMRDGLVLPNPSVMKPWKPQEMQTGHLCGMANRLQEWIDGQDSMSRLELSDPITPGCIEGWFAWLRIQAEKVTLSDEKLGFIDDLRELCHRGNEQVATDNNEINRRMIERLRAHVEQTERELRQTEEWRSDS